HPPHRPSPSPDLEWTFVDAHRFFMLTISRQAGKLISGEETWPGIALPWHTCATIRGKRSGKTSNRPTERHRMIANRKICVVLPAYNAARTLEMTFREIPADVVDDVILVDDASTDDTLRLAKSLGVFAVQHDYNKGYGGNQKTCYRLALERGADIIIMLHPD